MDDRLITLKHIDTSVAAKNVAKLLEENKTYFLNGNWGSGKTEFLVEVGKNTNKKLVTIELWRMSDNRSKIDIVFKKLHPCIYSFLRICLVLCVAVSILMTNVVDLGLSKFFGYWVVSVGGIVALSVGVYQFFKVKSDGFYSRFLKIKYF